MITGLSGTVRRNSSSLLLNESGLPSDSRILLGTQLKSLGPDTAKDIVFMDYNLLVELFSGGTMQSKPLRSLKRTVLILQPSTSRLDASPFIIRNTNLSRRLSREYRRNVFNLSSYSRNCIGQLSFSWKIVSRFPTP